MKNFTCLSVFAILIFTLSVATIPNAHAASMTFTTDTIITTSQTIASGETWTVNSGVTLTINSGVTITNSGTINNSNGGTINNSGNISNSGTINNIGILINNSGGSITNSSTINNSGNINNFSIITNSGTIINSFFITNDGIINNSGTINNFSIITNSGTINQCGGGGGVLGGLTGNPINNITCCVPSVPGEWMITSSCAIISNVIAPDNVHVQNNAVVTIENGGSLDVKFASNFLMIHYGSKVLIKSGGKIF